MTNEEAIAELKDVYANALEFADNRTKAAFDMAIEALKKPIPKPVSWEIDRTWGKATKVPVCPVCDAYLTPHSFFGFDAEEKFSWCDECGQKVSWEDADDN